MRFADNRNKIGKYIPAVVFLIFIYGMAFVVYLFSETRLQLFRKKILAEVSGGYSRKIAFG